VFSSRHFQEKEYACVTLARDVTFNRYRGLCSPCPPWFSLPLFPRRKGNQFRRPPQDTATRVGSLKPRSPNCQDHDGLPIIRDDCFLARITRGIPAEENVLNDRLSTQPVLRVQFDVAATFSPNRIDRASRSQLHQRRIPSETIAPASEPARTEQQPFSHSGHHHCHPGHRRHRLGSVVPCPQARADLVTAKVERKDLQLKITERGTLEAKENRDVKCEVKTGSRGAPKIKWVVENGTRSRRGTCWSRSTTRTSRNRPPTRKSSATRLRPTRSRRNSAIPARRPPLAWPKRIWRSGSRAITRSKLHDLEGQIQTSESNLLQEEDRTSWVSRMVKKGYMTASQEEAERALLMGNKLDLQKKQEQKKVLTDYTDPTTRQSLDNAILDAKIAEQTAKSTMPE